MAVLGLRGRVAFSEGDYRRAILDWSKLIEMLPAENTVTKELAVELDKARSAVGWPTGWRKWLAAVFSLQVSVAEALAADVQASAAGEQGWIAVYYRPSGRAEWWGRHWRFKRLPVTALPVQVVLDDSNLMLPGSTLADVPELSVVARISRSGAVKSTTG